jgi:hypothetical protein
MTKQEMIEILEQIARHGPPTAQIQAIRVLRELGVDKPAGTSFDDLDEVGLRRNGRGAPS